MTIFIALFVLLLIVVGNAPARSYDRQAKIEFEQFNEDAHKKNQQYAKEHDCYYERNNLLNLEVNPDYYSDGSLKRDSNTGLRYNKGEYYVNSKGKMANGHYDSTKRRPQ